MTRNPNVRPTLLRRFIDKEMPRKLVRQWDRDVHFPRDVHDKLVALGLTGLTVAEEYGGTGRDITAMIVVIEELSSRSMSVASGYIQSACYAALNIAEVASEEQKRSLLPRVANEGLMVAYGFSEPDVGADIASVRTTATVSDARLHVRVPSTTRATAGYSTVSSANSSLRSVGLAAPNVKAGKLFALGSTGATRAGALPDVPTIKEQGYPSLEFSSWFGVVAPAKTPTDILVKLSADIQKAVKAADGKARMEDAGFRVTGTSREEFTRIIAADTVTWGKAVAATGFKAD